MHDRRSEAERWMRVKSYVGSVATDVFQGDAETVREAADRLDVEEPGIRADIEYLAERVVEEARERRGDRGE